MRMIDGLKSNNSPELIPVNRKPERTLVSVLLSLLDIAPQFRAQLLQQCGYNSGRTCRFAGFLEPHYDFPGLPNRIPDALIACRRGQSTWTAFIEAKANDNPIRSEQIQEYAQFAKALEVPTIISISNEFALKPSLLPYHLPQNGRHGREIFHLSWSEIRTEIELHLNKKPDCEKAELAVLQHVLMFFDNKLSGVETYDTMPKEWGIIVDATNAHIPLSRNTTGLMDVLHGWRQERRDLRTKLRSLIGGDVELRHPAGARASEDEMIKYDKTQLVENYRLSAGYDIKRGLYHLGLTSDLRACSHAITLLVPLPKDKRAKGTISWLVSNFKGLLPNRYQLIIDWPGRNNEVLVPLDQLLCFPESVYRDQTSPPKSVWLATGHRDVRRFKNRKRFIEDLEGSAMQLIRDAIDNGILGK